MGLRNEESVKSFLHIWHQGEMGVNYWSRQHLEDYTQRKLEIFSIIISCIFDVRRDWTAGSPSCLPLVPWIIYGMVSRGCVKTFCKVHRHGSIHSSIHTLINNIHKLVFIFSIISLLKGDYLWCKALASRKKWSKNCVYPQILSHWWGGVFWDINLTSDLFTSS